MKGNTMTANAVRIKTANAIGTKTANAIRYWILCVFSLFSLTLFSQEQEAGELYAQGEYEKALLIYEDMLTQKPSSPLEYNIANTYFKLGELGKAILHYERALRLDPHNKDAQFNLMFAQQKIVDNIEEKPSFFLVEWAKWVSNLLSENTWTVASVVFFVVFLIVLMLYFFLTPLWGRKLSFHSAWISLLLCIVCTANAATLHNKTTKRQQAIIMKGIVNAKSSPDKSGNDLFVLHEGTKVTIHSAIGNWYEITVADYRGWVESNALERI